MTSPRARAIWSAPFDARFHADGAAVLDQHALRLRARYDAQVAAVAHRLQERLGGVDADAAALRDVEIGDAVIVAAVEVGDARHAGFDRRVADGVEDRPVQPLAVDAPLAAGAVQVVGAVHIVLVLRKYGSTSSQPQPWLPSWRHWS